MLNFLASNPVDRVNVIYRPLRGEASDRIVLIESQGKEHAFYPSDMETRIFTEKAVTAPWGAKLVFIPRNELSARSLEWVERLDLRFAGARPRAGAYAWTTVASGLLSVVLLVGLLMFIYRTFQGQFKPLRFMEPSQMLGSIDDLVGMDDIKAEVAQVKDQYQRRDRVCRIWRHQTLQCDVQRPGGNRQDQAGQLSGQGTSSSDPVPLRRQPGDGPGGRGLEHPCPHLHDGDAAQALHRLPGRGPGSFHETGWPPQVRRRHVEHLPIPAGRRAQPAGRRDHLDRGQQLQQRDHADGRSHAAPLRDESGFPAAQPGGAAGDHRALPGEAGRQGAARPGPQPPGGRDRGPAVRRTWRPSSTRPASPPYRRTR